jgi:RND family efflux transporter MFP subunit
MSAIGKMVRSICTVLALLSLVACTGPYSTKTVAATEQSKPVEVRVRTVTLERVPEVISATGELLAEDQATLRAKVAGRIAKLYVDLGTRVEEGALIAELEKDDYQLRLKQAEAAVEQTRARLGLAPGAGDNVKPQETAIVRQADASLKEARLIHANMSEMFKGGIVSNVDYLKAGVALQAAEARYQAAVEEVYRTQAELLQRRSELELAKQQLADTEIRAPFRGAITNRIGTVGEYLAVNSPVVVLVRWHPLRVRLQVPERQAFRVRAGQRIDLNLEGQSSPQPGRVLRMSPSMDAQNRSLIVEGEVPNEAGTLRAGSFVEATITVNHLATGVAIPAQAVLSFAGVERVFLVEGQALAERVVRLGRRLDKDRVVIQSGLSSKELVVLNPSDRYTGGQRVQITGRE